MSQPVSAFAAYSTNRKKNNSNKGTTVKRFGGKNSNTKAVKNTSKAKTATQKAKPKQNGVKKTVNGNSKKSKSDCDESFSNSDESGSSSYSDSDSYDTYDGTCDSQNCNCEETTSASGVYSDEYTINSYSDESESESGSDDHNESATGVVFSLDKLKGKAGNKRKSADDKSESSAATKQTKTTNTKNTANTETAATTTTAKNRKSLPAKTTATTTAGTVAKTKNGRRTIAAVGGKQNEPKIITNTVKLETISPSENINKSNSIEEGKRYFHWLMNPLTSKDFFEKYWEKNVCLIKREQADYYSHLISFSAIDKMLLDHHVEFTKNIDITSYKNGVRETLNPEGRALPPVVWDHYGQGCSIRILNPQTFLHPLFSLNSKLQEYFHCMVGANVYLTPPNSQGFAPHYDDIEAFVLQIEGRKRWRLYSPRNKGEALPRFSSGNFKQNEIGKPILDHVLQQGDVLYFPRGTIHQASTEPGYHSLHITISVYQKQSYGDLLELLLPKVLKSAIMNNLEFRQGLPLETWREAGIAFSSNDTRERANFLDQISKLLKKTLQTECMPELIDSAVDDMAKRFQHEALPPDLTSSERMRTIFGSKSVLNEKGECICDYLFDVKTNIRLLRANILRLVREADNRICIYFYAHNSKEYQEYEPNFIEITAEDASCVEVLLRSYPAYIGVSELPLSEDERKIELAQALWERGLLMLEKPLK